MDIKLEKGAALVLVGGPESEKTQRAIELAKACGLYGFITPSQIQDIPQMCAVFDNELKTLIVDEFIVNAKNLGAIKPLIANDKITVKRRGVETEIVDTPNFIFCTEDKNALRMLKGDRRFRVYEM